MGANNSFKPTPHRGVGHVLYATLARVRRPAAGRLNSGVRPQMTEIHESFNVYAPPASTLQPAVEPSIRPRFWTACACLTVAIPALIYVLRPTPAWLTFALLGCLWFLVAYWVLLPHFRHRGSTEPLDITYIVCTAIGIPVCTGLVSLVVLLVLGAISLVLLLL